MGNDGNRENVRRFKVVRRSLARRREAPSGRKWKFIVGAAIFSIIVFIKGCILGYITGSKRCGL